jgi:hypothetical protein
VAVGTSAFACYQGEDVEWTHGVDDVRVSTILGWLIKKSLKVSAAAVDPPLIGPVTCAIVHAARIDTTATRTSGSRVLTGIPSTAAMTVGAVVSGDGLPTGAAADELATIVTIDSSTQVTLSRAATSSGTGGTLTVLPTYKAAFNVDLDPSSYVYSDRRIDAGFNWQTAHGVVTVIDSASID